MRQNQRKIWNFDCSEERMKMKRKNAKLVCFFLSLLLAMGNPISALAAWENPFTDVKSRDWFYDAVEYVNTEGLFNGTAPDKFSPEAAMSRWNA